MNSWQITAIILAAGSSSRMGGKKKEFLKLKCSDFDPVIPILDKNFLFNNPTVLGSAVSAFASVSSVDAIIIVIPENEEAAARDALPPEILSAGKPEIFFVNGGNTRRASVFNALSFLASRSSDLPKTGYVLIHDGARPWVSSSLIENSITAVKKYDAVIPLLPLTDTPKETAEEQGTGSGDVTYIKNHLKRKNTGVAQTPQAFKFPEILHAHKKAALAENDEFTDDAEIWGRFCGQVAVIPGDPKNKKITFPGDLF